MHLPTLLQLEDKLVAGIVRGEDGALGVDIILIVLVLVKMVRGDVCDDGNVRAAAHAVQLEAAQLQHGEIIRMNVRRFAQERMADIAAEMDALSLLFQQLRDDGRRRGLAVAAGHGDDFARVLLM